MKHRHERERAFCKDPRGIIHVSSGSHGARSLMYCEVTAHFREEELVEVTAEFPTCFACIAEEPS